jgi:predicted amidophosphoribosyltransferase/GTPase SAR1 family protein
MSTRAYKRFIHRPLRRSRIIAWAQQQLMSVFGDKAYNKRYDKAQRMVRRLEKGLYRQGHVHIHKTGKKKGKENRVRVKYALLIDQRFLYCFVERLPYGVNWTDITSEKALTNLSVDVGVGDVIKDDDNKLLVRDGVTFRKFGDEIAFMLPFGGNMFPAKFLLRNFSMPEDAPMSAIPLGIAADKTHGWIDMADIFHLLVVGPTGRGKSTFLHSLILHILDKATPDDINLWMIDCKETEFHIYDSLLPNKQRRSSVVMRTEYNELQAMKLLQDAVDELDHRRKEFTRANANDITDFNQKTRNPRPLPRIIIIIDEVARLMLCDQKIEKKKIRDWAEYLLIMLATQGRSFGIHVIIATQYVSKDILTNGILLNFENVVCFGVKNMWQSNLAINDYHMAVGLGKGIIVMKRAEVGPRQYTKYKACLVEPSERRFRVERVKENGPGGALKVPEDTQKLVDDAILLLKICNADHAGQWSNRKIFQSDGVYGVIGKARVDEIANILEQHGVLAKSSRKTMPRTVQPAFTEGREHLLQYILAPQTTENEEEPLDTTFDTTLDTDTESQQQNTPVDPDVITLTNQEYQIKDLTRDPAEPTLSPDNDTINTIGEIAATIEQLQNDIKAALAGAPEEAQEIEQDIATVTAAAPLDAFHYAPYMHKRRDVRFHSIRKWRLHAKDASMKLMLEIKRTCDQTVIDAMAEEIAALLKSEYRLTAGTVTHPPRGGSGGKTKKHLATELAKSVAKKLDMPYLKAFEDKPNKRGHHPRQKTQALHDGEIQYTIATPPTVQPIILVDDVSTSGTTISLAAEMLEQYGMVIPVVWLAGETTLEEA